MLLAGGAAKDDESAEDDELDVVTIFMGVLFLIADILKEKNYH